MRDEKEERKKQARSNKQTRQSNTACTCTMHQYNIAFSCEQKQQEVYLPIGQELKTKSVCVLKYVHYTLYN